MIRVLGPRVLGSAPVYEGTQVLQKGSQCCLPRKGGSRGISTLSSTDPELGGLQGAGPTVEMRLREGRDRPHVPQSIDAGTQVRILPG